MRTLLAVVVAISSLSALAQQQPQPQTRKPAEIIFGDGDVIDGDTSKPDVEYLTRGGCVRHANLIRVREDFKDKVMASASEL
jgi:hypothetical protein